MKAGFTSIRTIVFGVMSLSFSGALAAQDFDFKTLDKLVANATNTANITLDGDTLRLAAGFLGNDQNKDAATLKSVVANLKGVYVRSFEFDKPGQYSEADVAPLRAYLKQPAWKNIVDVREGKQSTQVYLMPTANNKLAGVAVVSTEPTEVTIVFISGLLDESDLQKLSGNMGIPEIKGLPGVKADKKTK